MTLHAGLDMGGTNLRIGIVDGTRVIHQQRFHADFARLCRENNPDVAWPIIVEALAGSLQEVLQAHPEVVSIGIGFPGFVDSTNGIVLQSPNLPGLYQVNVAADVSAKIGRPVVVENDAAAAAYGEYRLSPGRGGSLVYIGLGTGVGGGLVLDGRPYTGEHGAAMEVGHLIVAYGDNARPCGCGNRGCLEQYAAAGGVTLSYKLAAGVELNSVEIANLARSGDEKALAAYRLAGTCLAQAIAHLAKVLDVGHVVIGGGLSNAWVLMQEAFYDQLNNSLIPALRKNIGIRISTSGDEAGIIGSALLAAEL
ncbi:MAG TPA: ROK family protein [Methylophilaceae bacterium]|nr:ROK family protein [Methylophilaceae bacterium]